METQIYLHHKEHLCAIVYAEEGKKEWTTSSVAPHNNKLKPLLTCGTTPSPTGEGTMFDLDLNLENFILFYN